MIIVMVGEAAGEERFRQLVDTAVYTALWRYICRISTVREDAEDLLQETLALGYQRLDQLREASTVKGWLIAIARNLHLSRLRSRQIASASTGVDAAGVVSGPPLELAQAVRQAVTLLPGAQREAVELFHLDGLSLRETALALGVSENNVKQRLWRARQSLAEQLRGSLRAGELEGMF